MLEDINSLLKIQKGGEEWQRPLYLSNLRPHAEILQAWMFTETETVKVEEPEQEKEGQPPAAAQVQQEAASEEAEQQKLEEEKGQGPGVQNGDDKDKEQHPLAAAAVPAVQPTGPESVEVAQPEAGAVGPAKETSSQETAAERGEAKESDAEASATVAPTSPSSAATAQKGLEAEQSPAAKSEGSGRSANAAPANGVSLCAKDTKLEVTAFMHPQDEKLRCLLDRHEGLHRVKVHNYARTLHTMGELVANFRQVSEHTELDRLSRMWKRMLASSKEIYSGAYMAVNDLQKAEVAHQSAQLSAPCPSGPAMIGESIRGESVACNFSESYDSVVIC